MICYYCETNTASTTKFSEPICDKCNQQEFRAIMDPSKTATEDDDNKALRLKFVIAMYQRGQEALKGEKK